MELLKLLSANEMVAQLISFFILFFLLRAFAWKRLLKLLDDRKAHIASEFQQIENTKAEIAKIKADYEAKLETIDSESRARIQEAMEAAKKITNEIHKKANEEAEQIIVHAREHVKYELSKVQHQLRQELVDLTIKAAEAVIQERLTEQHDRRLVEDFLNRIEKHNER